MSRIKVLHVTQATIGGTVEYLRLLLPRLDRATFDLEIACPRYGPLTSEAVALGFPVHEAHMVRDVSPRHDVRSYARLVDLIRTRQPDLVHLHSSKAGVIGRLAAFRCGVPAIYTAHGWSFGMDVSPRVKHMYALIERLCSPMTDLIVNISDDEQRLARKFHVGAGADMITIVSGIDPERFRQPKDAGLMNELGIPPDAFVIGMVARLHAAKSPQTYVKVARAVTQHIPNAYFLLIGDGPLRAEVESELDHLQLRRQFRVTGWVPSVERIVALLDVGVLTSAWEGFGLAITEYMAAGKPVVASRAGGIKDIVTHGDNGLLVDVGDVAGFAQTIRELHRDPSTRERLARRGYQTVVERFHIDRVVRQHETAYAAVVARRSGTAWPQQA